MLHKLPKGKKREKLYQKIGNLLNKKIENRNINIWILKK